MLRRLNKSTIVSFIKTANGVFSSNVQTSKKKDDTTRDNTFHRQMVDQSN
jgi:hypothetical protein